MEKEKVTEVKAEEVKVETEVKPEPAVEGEKINLRKEAINRLKLAQEPKGTFILSIVGFVLSFFVMVVTLTIKAQPGFAIIPLVLLAIYMVAIGIVALGVDFTALTLSKNRLKQKKGLIAFLVAVVSVLLVLGSLLIIYFA
ncbi:MAG: hypothetical protein AB7S44_00010 [Spirochaetales bacterium]